MPAKLSQDQKVKKEIEIAKTQRLIKEAGGPTVIARVLSKKDPKINQRAVANFGYRGSIPDQYYLDIIGMTNRPPSYLRPALFNVRHPAFRRHYAQQPKKPVSKSTKPDG